MFVQIATQLNSVLVIIFRNLTHGEGDQQIHAWVCQDREVFDSQLASLKNQNHIQIVSAGLQTLKTEVAEQNIAA